MKEDEVIFLVRQAFRMMAAAGQENGNITIEVRQGEGKHVRFDLEVKRKSSAGKNNGTILA